MASTVEGKGVGKASTKRRGGRPSKRCPQREEALCTFIAGGASQDQAADLLGISRRTLRRWLKEDRKLLARVREARAEGVVTTRAHLKDQAARGDTRAAIAWLKQVEPQRLTGDPEPERAPDAAEQVQALCEALAAAERRASAAEDRVRDLEAELKRARAAGRPIIPPAPVEPSRSVARSRSRKREGAASAS